MEPKRVSTEELVEAFLNEVRLAPEQRELFLQVVKLARGNARSGAFGLNRSVQMGPGVEVCPNCGQQIP
jgi:hypothetical protein